MPLLSLIEDNLNFVLELSIPAISLSVGNTQKEDKKIGHLYNEIRQIQHKIVYLTPEKLVKSPALMNVLDELYVQNKIDRFVIDEVHCVSHWGQDFRKDYLHLDILKKRFPEVPILGLTATATQKVKDDMAKRLGITKTVYYFQSSFNRPNLVYEIRPKKQLKSIDSDLVQLLKTRFKNKSGIIYCVSKKDCEKLAETLKRNY
jgi:RecQ family ATP-dependent DNA helicase